MAHEFESGQIVPRRSEFGITKVVKFRQKEWAWSIFSCGCAPRTTYIDSSTSVFAYYEPSVTELYTVRGFLQVISHSLLDRFRLTSCWRRPTSRSAQPSGRRGVCCVGSCRKSAGRWTERECEEVTVPQCTEHAGAEWAKRRGVRDES